MNVETFFKVLGELYGKANKVKVTYKVTRKEREAQ